MLLDNLFSIAGPSVTSVLLVCVLIGCGAPALVAIASPHDD